MKLRLGLAAACLVFLGACATVSLGHDEVARVVNGAFARAGVDHGPVTVADAADGPLWDAATTVNGARLGLQVDRVKGRVARVDLGTKGTLTDTQLDRIAHYASNPADERAQRRRTVLLLLVVFAGIGVGLLAARRARLGEEARAAEAQAAEAHTAEAHTEVLDALESPTVESPTVESPTLDSPTATPESVRDSA